METKDWRILAYLKNAISETLVKVEVAKDRDDLINEVMKLREMKRAQLTIEQVLEQTKDK